MFEAPGSGHGHGQHEPISIAMGGGGLLAGPGSSAADGSAALRRHPDWIRARIPSGENYHDLKGLLRGLNLNTVCEEAHCPNIGECWDQRTATIMILGDTCTRACGFCAVKTGRPTWFDDDEPRRVAEAVSALGLEHVVVTSVARDDLQDGGSRIFAETIGRLRESCPGMGIEVLIPDFDGSDDRLRTVMDARPDILNHNLETVRRLQKPVRKQARWDRSLYVLRRAKEMSDDIGYAAHTKSSLMVGLGESREEMTEAFEALRAAVVGLLVLVALVVAVAKPWATPGSGREAVAKDTVHGQSSPSATLPSEAPSSSVALPRVLTSGAQAPPSLGGSPTAAAIVRELAQRSGAWGVGTGGSGPRMVRDDPWFDWVPVDPASDQRDGGSRLGVWPDSGLCSHTP